MTGLTLLTPLVAFGILLLAAIFVYIAFSRLSPGRRAKGARGLGPYSCGEDLPTHMIQPDYSQFYPFAFFFTILHVVALMATTVPMATVSTIMVACVYVLGAVAGLTILYRK